MTIAPKPAVARIIRIHPEGSTLTTEAGVPLTVGSQVTDGDALVHATSDGEQGCISLSAKGVALRVRAVKAEAFADAIEKVTGRRDLPTSHGLGMGGPIAVDRNV